MTDRQALAVELSLFVIFSSVPGPTYWAIRNFLVAAGVGVLNPPVVCEAAHCGGNAGCVLSGIGTCAPIQRIETKASKVT